jgi:CAAX protease family protein
MNNSENILKNHFWGAWATLGFSVLIYVIIIILNIIIILYFLFSTSYSLDITVITNLINRFITDGQILAFTTFVNAFAGILLVYLIIKLRKGHNFKEYIGFNTFKWKTFLYLILILIFYLWFFNIASIIYNNTVTTEFVVDIYKSNVSWYTVTFVIVIVAPVFEEIIFRGFIFEGILNSKLGKIGAVLITSIIWAVIHIQYDIFGISSIFVLGIILGMTKLKTNSIIYCIGGHIFINLLASLETMNYLH